MEFLITQYIYPLQDKVVLSKNLGFWLDNPRTELEISAVSDYLLRAYESGYDYKFPVYSDEPIITIEGILFDFRDALSNSDASLEKVFRMYDRENVFEFLAKMWVIARYDDKGLGDELREEHKKMRDKGTNGFFLLDDNHPLITRPEALANYCSLLSLLVNTERNDYFGRQILLDDESIDPQEPVKKIWQEFLMFGVAAKRFPENKDQLAWIFFPHSQGNILESASQLENIINSGDEEKLLYIGSILKTASETSLDIRTRIVLLTSVMELLLTHNPDFNRFNVEDSINKQFQLKASILIYLNDKSRNLNQIQKRLKTIYAQRSNIAHGNFQALNKYIQSLSKKEGSEEFISDLVVDLYQYVRAVLEEYLKDKGFVEFLKNG